MSETLSTTEAKQLFRLCKLGRLFEVQNWISSGNSLSVPAELRTTPLAVALDTGFHSLVELLVRNEPSQDLKNRALQHALAHLLIQKFHNALKLTWDLVGYEQEPEPALF